MRKNLVIEIRKTKDGGYIIITRSGLFSKEVFVAETFENLKSKIQKLLSEKAGS